MAAQHVQPLPEYLCPDCLQPLHEFYYQSGPAWVCRNAIGEVGLDPETGRRYIPPGSVHRIVVYYRRDKYTGRLASTWRGF